MLNFHFIFIGIDNHFVFVHGFLLGVILLSKTCAWFSSFKKLGISSFSFSKNITISYLALRRMATYFMRNHFSVDNCFHGH